MDKEDSIERLAAELTTRVGELAPSSRLIVGIAGIPGAGKSTVAELLVSEINRLLANHRASDHASEPVFASQHANDHASQRTSEKPPAIVVPMDGFHHSNEKLTAMGLLPLKGVPDSFDAIGFVRLLQQLRTNTTTAIAAPLFDRSIEASIEGGIVIEPYHKICVVEGNYLLLETPPWREARRYFDEVWFLDVSLETVYPRLVARHLLARTATETKVKIESTDVPNAHLILASKVQADRLLNFALKI